MIELTLWPIAVTYNYRQSNKQRYWRLILDCLKRFWSVTVYLCSGLLELLLGGGKICSSEFVQFVAIWSDIKKVWSDMESRLPSNRNWDLCLQTDQSTPLCIGLLSVWIWKSMLCYFLDSRTWNLNCLSVFHSMENHRYYNSLKNGWIYADVYRPRYTKPRLD